MTKKYDIIHLNGFMYAADKEAKIEGKEPKVIYFPKENKVVHYNKLGAYTNGLESVRPEWCIKVIATNDSSLGLPLLPEIEEDERKRLTEIAVKKYRAYGSGAVWVGVEGYLDGYKAASAKKYTEEDMRKAYAAGGLWQFCIYNRKAVKMSDAKPMIFEEFIKSLNPLPIAVELEMEGSELDDYVQHKNNPIVQAFSPHRTPLILKIENNFVKVVKWIYHDLH